MTDNKEPDNKMPDDGMPDSDESGIERRLEAMIRQQTESVPAEIGEQLATIRRQAVAQTETETDSHRRPSVWSFSQNAVALAGAVAAIVIGIWILRWPADEVLLEIPLVGAAEVVLVQDLALLEELEFAAWLEQDNVEPGGLDEEPPGAG